MFKNRKAKKLGLLWDAGQSVIGGVIIHNKCGKRLRVGINSKEETIEWCPKCMEIIGKTSCQGF